MYRIYHRISRLFLTIYLNESLKIKTELDNSISILFKNGKRNLKTDNFFFLIDRTWTDFQNHI